VKSKNEDDQSVKIIPLLVRVEGSGFSRRGMRALEEGEDRKIASVYENNETMMGSARFRKLNLN